MVACLKNFHLLLLSLAFALALLSLLPGAVDGAEAKTVAYRSTQHKKTHALAAAAHHHHHKHHKHHKHKGHKKHRKHKKHKGHKKHKKHPYQHKATHHHVPNTTGHSANPGSFDHLIPYGLKAGITGEDGLPALSPYIGSYSNWKPQPWSPEPPKNVAFFPMAWGAGQSSAHDGELLRTFKSLFGASSSHRSSPPKVVLGFEEPDCPTGHGSSGVSVGLAARVWNQVIGPLKQDGTILVSPSMCHQTAETWLTPFEEQIDVPFDVTNVHVNQDNIDDVKREIDYYWNKYGKPIYVTEFACVHTNPWRPATNQALINSYIRDIVDYFESDDRVAVYQYSTGVGLADQWRLTKPGTKELTESGRVYRDAIRKYASKKSARMGLKRRDEPEPEAEADADVEVDEDDTEEEDDVDVTNLDTVADENGDAAAEPDADADEDADDVDVTLS
ncbi:hypothetical protein OC834_002689 [Tilletia horrida]|nr:hypothetical protein OC834_002689 [Tilletia horrida]